MQCINILNAVVVMPTDLFATFNPQVIGFVYGLIVEQFGWTVYIVLGGFAVSCVVMCLIFLV